MKNGIKRVFKYYTIADWEREQNWLTEMASQGWRFLKTNGFFYTFERWEPENVAYRLDYSGLREGDRGDYYAMLRDYGWEYLQDINGFSYFRKPADGVSKEELELFSDGESRIKMIKKFLVAKMPLAYLIFLAVILVNAEPYCDVIVKLLHGESLQIGEVHILLSLAVLIAVHIFVTVQSVRAYHRIKKEYQNRA